MDATVLGFAQALTIGQPTAHGGFVLVPLYSEMEGTLNYISLQTAIESGSVRVEEVSEAGSVGDLRLTNEGNLPVLAIDGEEVAGAKQNRILNTTVLLKQHTKTVIPVSCTEQGRWSYVSSREFSASDSFAPPRIRENAKRAVNRSLREQRGFRADQGAVWDEVAALAYDAGVHSPTSAMSDVVKTRLSELDGTIDAFPIEGPQRGMVAISNGQVLGFDVVSSADIYAVLHKRLLRSYLLNGATPSRTSAGRNAAVLAEAFLCNAMESSEQRFKSPGMGDDLRYSGHNLVGSALVAEGEVVHMAFFHASDTAVEGARPGLGSYRTRMGFRRQEPYER
jgi:hypothetical protein